MVGENDSRVHLKGEMPLCSAENTQNRVARSRRRLQEETTVEGSAGDLNQRAIGDESK